ncbi:MAG: hypothetical protein HXY44_02315 [Syntrophaceae bacterium]|nr:hypothetical protein [Syntrophaceae bacterium]
MKTNYFMICLRWILYHFFIFFLIISICPQCLSQILNESPHQIWNVGDRRWTVEEEYRFGKWVDENITEDFFIRYKIPTDCADVPYAVRWIYARIASLPAAATTKDGKLIGHWSTHWKHLPTYPEWHQDKRFRAALLYLISETWTGTLPHDTYPIRISPDSVTPGTLLSMAKSHVGIIGHVCLDGSQAHPLQTWESMLPVKIRKLSLRDFFSPKPEPTHPLGLVKFRWPIMVNGEWKYLPPKKHPFYSEEQYHPTFYKDSSDFVEAVAKRIDPTEYDPMVKVTKIVETTTRILRERIPIVLTGHQLCARGGCTEGSDLWEIHNTLSRDEMVILLMDHLSRIIQSNDLDQEVMERMMRSISIDISKSHSITFYDVYQNCPWFSPHPKDSIEARWGLKKCEMILDQVRTAKNCIAFIEKVYGKRDPIYANFSIRQQQEILRRLNEELMKSGCFFAVSDMNENQGKTRRLEETSLRR